MARAEPPLARSLLPEPSHAGDEREFPVATVRAYQNTMTLGVEEFAEGRWPEARALFLRGHALLPNARSFRVLGMTAFNLKLYPIALRELSAALRDSRRPLSRVLRGQTELLRDRAQAFVGRYRVRVEPPSAELRIDGMVVKPEVDGSLLVAVGAHSLEAEARGYELLIRALRVEGGDNDPLVLRLRPLPPPELALPRQEGSVHSTGASAKSAQKAVELRPTRPVGERVFGDYRWTWITGASALALGGASLPLHFQAVDEARKVRARCDRVDCYPWDNATSRRDKLYGWSDGLWISSLVLSLTAGVLAFVEHRRAVDRPPTWSSAR